MEGTSGWGPMEGTSGWGPMEGTSGWGPMEGTIGWGPMEGTHGSLVRAKRAAMSEASRKSRCTLATNAKAQSG
jgi:hypothetical protein